MGNEPQKYSMCNIERFHDSFVWYLKFNVWLVPNNQLIVILDRGWAEGTKGLLSLGTLYLALNDPLNQGS